MLKTIHVWQEFWDHPIYPSLRIQIGELFQKAFHCYSLGCQNPT